MYGFASLNNCGTFDFRSSKPACADSRVLYEAMCATYKLASCATADGAARVATVIALANNHHFIEMSHTPNYLMLVRFWFGSSAQVAGRCPLIPFRALSKSRAKHSASGPPEKLPGRQP